MELKTFSFLSCKPVDPGLSTQSNMFFRTEGLERSSVPDFHKWEGIKAHPVLQGIGGFYTACGGTDWNGRFVKSGSYFCGFILGKNISEKKKTSNSQNARGQIIFWPSLFLSVFLLSSLFFVSKVRCQVMREMCMGWWAHLYHLDALHHYNTLVFQLWMLCATYGPFLSYSDNCTVIHQMYISVAVHDKTLLKLYSPAICRNTGVSMTQQ